MASAVPPSLKSIGGYVKIANDSANRDPVIYYWCLYYAAKQAMKIDRTSEDALRFITGVLSTLETVKTQCHEVEAITNEVVAQAHLENYALKLFGYADAREKNGQADKTTFHAFYNAGLVMDTLSLFGELDENVASMKKYAKYTSAQIGKCLRDGTPYVSATPQEPKESPTSLDGQNPAYGGNQNPFGGNSSADYGYSAGTQSDIHSLPSVPFHGNESHIPPSNPIVPSYGFSSQLDSYPGGHEVAQPPAPMLPVEPEAAPVAAPRAASGRVPSSQDFMDARKFAKYAISALDYEDTKAAIDNLRKALASLE